MTKIFVTIAICTWNRAHSLRTTLASLRDMEDAGNIEWEVLIINNNCTDNTEDVVAEFAGALPLRQIAEREQGLSSARNRALAAALGTHILWTDDDVAVDRQWLKSYADAFAKWTNAAVFGGPILPQFVGQLPSWLEQALKENGIGSVYALRNLAAEPIMLDIGTNRIPFGANYAVRLKEQRQFPYDPRLGRRKQDKICGEEVDVIGRILGSGAEGRWVPDAVVYHVIAKDRQTTAYVREWFVGYGRTKVRRSPAYDGPSFMGAPRWLWRAAITSEASFRVKRIFCPPGTWCRELAKASSHWGQISEYRNTTPR